MGVLVWIFLFWWIVREQRGCIYRHCDSVCRSTATVFFGVGVVIKLSDEVIGAIGAAGALRGQIRRRLRASGAGQDSRSFEVNLARNVTNASFSAMAHRRRLPLEIHRPQLHMRQVATALAGAGFIQSPIFLQWPADAAPWSDQFSWCVRCHSVAAVSLSSPRGGALAPASQCPRAPTPRTYRCACARGAGRRIGCAWSRSSGPGSRS